MMNINLSNIKEKALLNIGKKKGESLLMSVAAYIVALAIILGVAVMLLGDTDPSKITVTKQELDQIRTAVVEYRTYRIDGASPASLGELLNDPVIASSDSIDGRAHHPTLTTNPRWSNSGLKDMWGNDYVLDGNTVYSTAGSTDETDRVSLEIGGLSDN